MSNGVEVLVKDKNSDGKQEQTKYMEVKTIQPTAANVFINNFPKIDKREDNEGDNDGYDFIQPSELHTPCATSCSCSHKKTEGLKTQHTNINVISASTPLKYAIKTTNYGTTKLNLRPTNKESLDLKKTPYGPYEYESSSQLAPTDRIVEKYTEVISDYSDEKESDSVKHAELLTNEQAPIPSSINKVPKDKNPEKAKPVKPHKPNKNKLVVADLLKLGSLGIKGLSQLAPVIEKMTGDFMRRQDSNKTFSTSEKPEIKLTPYNVDKRVDSEEIKNSNFPIYIPVDDIETSESQSIFSNATLHQSLAWAAEHKKPKARIVPPKMIHESPLVNGGIPISPGEIITANSDVIVGKPAVGGPLTFAASGIKFHSSVNPPPIDSFVSGNEHYIVKEPTLSDQTVQASQVDDSFDLRPPEIPKGKSNPTRNLLRPNLASFSHQNNYMNKQPLHMPPKLTHNDQLMKTEQIKTTVLGNHGRPAFLDYIPSSFGKPYSLSKDNIKFRPINEEDQSSEEEDNSPSSSEIINAHIKNEIKFGSSSDKPFLVDIQPSRVANVLIPHGSSTALVFAGSSEPHKTGDYVDDPLPYPEPGYFGSFSIDAPQMTNVHNVAPNNKPSNMGGRPSLDSYKPIMTQPHKDQPLRNELKYKWSDNNRPKEHHNRLPPPTSNQHTHLQVGPKITVYNPDNYKGDFEKYNNVKEIKNHNDVKETIDREYENYLAVPPPPPPKPHFHKESHYDQNKPYHQRPIVHTKPIQDMKVFLNIQHPIPNNLPKEQPQKVTSEIYFASQMPNNQATPSYTIQIPSSPATFENNNVFKDHQQAVSNANSGQVISSFSIPTYLSKDNKTILAHNNSDKDNIYTVTLNTATNVANHVGENAQVIGSSISVPIDGSNLNTNIPIGTDFAIKVEDDSTLLQSFNSQEQISPQIVYENHVRIPVKVSTEDNRWNKSTHYRDKAKYEINVIGNKNNGQGYAANPSKEGRPLVTSVNSHANFPMINEHYASVGAYENIKPVTENVEETTLTDQTRPPKLIPNIPTNSHGWYSSGITNNKDINNIKLEVTTGKAIPLLPEYNNDSVPEFGQKINSIGKPPLDFWSQNPQSVNLNVGKPYTINEKPDQSNALSLSNKPSHINYIPSNIGINKQPVYDIPIRDNSDETTTVKTAIDKDKPVYENSEEVYDGEENGSSGEVSSDEEVSLESMKVPFVSSVDKKYSSHKPSTDIMLLQDEVYGLTINTQTEKNIQQVIFNPGTQTEKPFDSHKNNNAFQSNSKPNYNNSHYMKPRPFTVNSAPTLDHQLQQPHWQINQLMVNSTNMSYEENLELNIGEEVSTIKPFTHTVHYHHGEPDQKYKKRLRPEYVKPHVNISNIITSTVHIQDKKPLIIEEEDGISTSITTSTIELNRSSSEIIDLSPPPPTMDFNFKPSTNDEMIMGMSPPPPISSGPPLMRNTPTARPVEWAPLTHRPLPIRTSLPYRTKPPRMPIKRPVRKPVRDEVSTYRPPSDIQNNANRPIFNRDQPSSQLLPPPRELPSRVVVSPLQEVPVPTLNTIASTSNIVFPTLISSGWLTSAGVDFSSSFGIKPTSVQFPNTPEPTELVDFTETSSENTYKVGTSSERIDDTTWDNPVPKNSTMNSKEASTESSTTKLSTNTKVSDNDSIANEPSQEDVSTVKNKIFLSNKNRTRKPYPLRYDDRNTSTSKFRLPPKPTSVIRPTKTLTRSEVLYPTRQTTIRKIVRPIPTRSSTVTPSIIESSESAIEDEFIKPTEILKESQLPTVAQHEPSSSTDKVSASGYVPSDIDTSSKIQPTHHAGNEVKISDEIVPTKTEFKTTVVTLTKTLSEPPQTVSSIGYVNLTHTLTVTHTKTSLVSKSEGAVTQTLVLTNTQTSTIVDVVTEIHTQVQPTTIIETVTKHIPVQVEATPVQKESSKTKVPLDDISMFSEEENLIITNDEITENVQKIDSGTDSDNDTFFVVMNKSQNGGKLPSANTDIGTGDYDGITRNEQVNSNGVSQVLFGEILLAGTPYLETTNVVNPTGVGYSKECQPDCKASRNERCQRIDGIMKCVCRPGFARMFPDRPCKPTYTYSVKLALGSQGKQRLVFHPNLADNSSKEYHDLAKATHEGINRMVMQSDLRDVFHGVHITGFHEVEMKVGGEEYQGVINDFYVQLSDNAHESRLKEVIEKYLRNNNYSLGGTDVHAAAELMDRLDVSDFDECTSGQFHDCSEHAQCFNLRGTYTCSCLEGFGDLSVNQLYPGRICSAEPVGCDRCNYHGSCYSRDDQRVLCECFQWYAGSSCHINLKVVLISLVVLGALLTAVLAICAVVACSKRPRPPPRSIVTCITGMPGLHQGAMPSKQRERNDRRALINDRAESGDASSVQNASLPYMPAKKCSKKHVISEPPAHAPPPVPAPAVMIPRARFHSTHHDSRDNIVRKRSLELSSEAKLISYLESGAAVNNNEEMRRKHSMESSYSANKDRIINKQGALVSAGFKVSTTIRPDDRDDLSSVNKADLEAELHFDSLRKTYSQDDISEWTDAERRMGELTLSEARSVGGTLPASTGRAASSTRLTHQEANTMAERDLGSTFLLPHVHLYKPDISNESGIGTAKESLNKTSDVSEFDSL